MPRRPVLAAVLLAALTACGAASPARPTGSATGSPAPRDAQSSAGQVSSGARTQSAASGPSTTHPCGWSSTASYTHVVWIWMENRAYGSVLGTNSTAPHAKAYGGRCGVATNYHAITHPSLPNYVAAVSGSTLGITTDCEPSSCSRNASTIFGQVSQAGRHWHGYAESMSQNCQQVSAGRYAARHNPAVYFLPVRSRCDQWDVRMGGAGGAFATALADNRLAAFSFVTPNLCSDGHDCSLATADAWLGTWLDRIVTSRAYAAGHTVVFVTWDEDDSAHANHVATIVIGPTVPPGTRASGSFTHYSLLRTTESILGLAHLRNAATAHGMRGAFHL